MEEEPRSVVRVLLRNGDEHTFPNAEYQVDFPAASLATPRRARVLPVMLLEGDILAGMRGVTP